MKEKAKAGRPSLLTEDVTGEICERLAMGETLVAICSDDRMPSRTTVNNWILNDADFGARCARARELGGDAMDELILQAAQSVTPESAAAERVRISAYQWRASKLAPKKYGDKLAIGGDADAPPIQSEMVVRFVKPAQ